MYFLFNLSAHKLFVQESWTWIQVNKQEFWWLNVVEQTVEKIRLGAVVQLQAQANTGPISCIIIINLTYEVFKISLFNQRSVK